MTALHVGGATQLHRGEVANGDAWCSQETSAGMRVALIDGVGHGPLAAEAARVALSVLADWPEGSPRDVLVACHAALRATRGAVIAVALFDIRAETLTFAGVGNVEGRLWRPERERYLTSQRGVLGFNIPTVRPIEFSLDGEWMFVMRSDGIHSSLRVSEYAPMRTAQMPSEIAQSMVTDHSRGDDDATIVVVVS